MNFSSARIKANLTQLKAAAKIGVDRSTIAKWESGASMPRAGLLPLIAETYGCDIPTLLAPDMASADGDGVALQNESA